MQGRQKGAEALQHGSGSAGDHDDGGDLFRVRASADGAAPDQAAARGDNDVDADDAPDVSAPALAAPDLARWRAGGAAEALRDRFVTGEQVLLLIFSGSVAEGRLAEGRLHPAKKTCSYFVGKMIHKALCSLGSNALWLCPCASAAPWSHESGMPCWPGDWEAAEARAAAGPDEGGSEGEAFGDFEDLETGQRFGQDGDAATTAAMAAIRDEAKAEAKAAKKAAFDAEYDAGEAPSEERHRAAYYWVMIPFVGIPRPA